MGTSSFLVCKGRPSKKYVDYREWSQPISGRKDVVQAFQGAGVVIDEKGKRLVVPCRGGMRSGCETSSADLCDVGRSGTATGRSGNVENN
jgi:hypothetical protein